MGQGLRLARSCPPKLRAGTPAPQRPTFPARLPASSAGLSSGMAVCGALIPPPLLAARRQGAERPRDRGVCCGPDAGSHPPSGSLRLLQPTSTPPHTGPSAYGSSWTSVRTNLCPSPPSEGAPHNVTGAAEGQGWGQGQRLTQPSGPRGLPGEGQLI